MSGKSQASVGGGRRTPERHRKSLLQDTNFQRIVPEWVVVRARAGWIETEAHKGKRGR